MIDVGCACGSWCDEKVWMCSDDEDGTRRYGVCTLSRFQFSTEIALSDSVSRETDCDSNDAQRISHMWHYH